MIEYLRISNMALIKDLELELAPGINVLTGETGAGKSLVIKAINFLTGDRVWPNLVRPGEDKATVEALFALPDKDLVLRREMVAETGRTRIFINNTLGTQDEVRALRPSLLLHTSQFGQQKLLQPAYQAKIIDSFIKDPTILDRRDQLRAEFDALLKKEKKTLAHYQALRDKRELLEFQKQEIDKIKPVKDEESSLEAEKTAIKNAAVNALALERIYGLLQGEASGWPGLLDGLAALEKELDTLAESNSDYESCRAEVVDARARLKDIAAGLKPGHNTAAGERDLERIEARLFALAQLRRKLGRPLNAIVDLGQEIEENLSFLDAGQLDLARLDRDKTALADRLGQTLSELNQARRTAGQELAEVLTGRLVALGFSKEVAIDIQYNPDEIYPGLFEDQPRILWRPNPGQPMQPLDKIASGGELSRFLLAVSGIMAETEEKPTLIFDEVDSGVGGLTLNRVAEHIENLAGRQQIILITHWPRLARLASKPSRAIRGKHFQIFKEVIGQETFSHGRLLQGQDLAEELKRMAGLEDE